MFRFRPLVASILGLVYLSSAQADGLDYSQTNSGEVGLVEMPTSRMYPEGEFGVHISRVLPYTRLSVIAQPFPWFQFLFKYTDISNRFYGTSIAGSQSYKDKSIDFKARLIKEGYYTPEVSLGIRDIGGTALFSGEYLALSKQIRNMDFTLGLGWGYLGQQGHFDNPLGRLDDSFYVRKERDPETDNGGNLSYFNYFHGPKVALFAGAEYHFTHYPLTLKVEYDANDYQNEPKDNVFEQKIPINLGAVYSPMKGVDFQVGIVRGDTFYAGISLKTNIKTAHNPKFLDPKPVSVSEEPKPQIADWPVIDKSLRDLAGLDIESIETDNSSIYLYGKQAQYSDLKGVGRAARILDNQLPEQYQEFHFIELEYGMPVSQINLSRQVFHAAADLQTDIAPLQANVQFSDPKQEVIQQQVYENSSSGRLNYEITPSLSGSFGGPDGFLLYQLSLSLNSDYRLRDDLLLSGSLSLGLLDNYDKFEYRAESLLPRVRTDIRDYLKDSSLRMDNLQLTHFSQLAPGLYTSIYAGYLEWMYGGIGGEMLYRPQNSAWAVGLDVNRVKQRDFNQGFGFRDYEITTGHLSYYYHLAENILAKVSGGQYLAGDRGVTIDLIHRFKNGAAIGVWATKTNVSAEQFGEGSFDKGFYYRFPLNLFSFRSTKEVSQLDWQFLTRDGGQKLKRSYRLYELTQSRDLKIVQQGFDQILD